MLADLRPVFLTEENRGEKSVEREGGREKKEEERS